VLEAASFEDFPEELAETLSFNSFDVAVVPAADVWPAVVVVSPVFTSPVVVPAALVAVVFEFAVAFAVDV
jgi:hypothetical protein